MSKTKLLVVSLLVPLLAVAAPVGDYQFKSPAFNGAGYSSHVLTIDNLERTRQKEREDKIQAAIDKAAAESKNSNLSKFLSNLESRIYAQISQNVATAMFANNSCSVNSATNCQGSINFQGNTIGWQRISDAFNCTGSSNGTCIQLTVADPSGSTTNIYVPLESFQMPGN
jgi:Flp pilus assembly protein TadG